jgi:bisphosphoglycerate-dependent phosphoglycerate mutase
MQEINDIVYKQKYLKYKAKYLELQEQIGGDDEIRFKNCAILKLSIRNNSGKTTANLDMIYSGKVNDKRKYYVSVNDELINNMTGTIQLNLKTFKFELENQLTHTDQNYIVCTHNTRLRCFIDNYFDIKDNNTDIEISDNQYVFYTRTAKDINELLGNRYNKKNIDIYIIRHGEGTHNVKKGFSKAFKVYNDTLLTENGIKQAENAGTQLNKYFNSNKIEKIDGLFASKLKRTRQTLTKLLENIKLLNIPTEIIILPCSHELTDFTKDKNCEDGNEGKPVAFENRSKCVCGSIDTMSCTNTQETQKTQEICKKEDIYDINWKYFNIFYSKRKETAKSVNYTGCRNTNFIKQIIEILKGIENYKKEYMLSSDVQKSKENQSAKKRHIRLKY